MEERIRDCPWCKRPFPQPVHEITMEELGQSESLLGKGLLQRVSYTVTPWDGCRGEIQDASGVVHKFEVIDATATAVRV